MTTPAATIKAPDSRDQLHDAFMTLAKRSYELSEQALRNVDFYDAVLRKLDRGESIQEDVPSVKGLMLDAVYLTVQRLRRLNQIRVQEAWELPASYQGCLQATIRYALPPNELIPQFDVQYAAQVDAGPVKIVVKTFRRVIDVEVQGSDEALDQLWILISIAIMTAK